MLVRVQRFPVASSLFGPLGGFESRIDEIFDGVWGTSVQNPTGKYPAVDIAEYENETVVVAEMPGIRKEDLKLSVHDGLLTLSGERKAQQLPEHASWLRNEAATGAFTRTIQLPHDVKMDAVSAELTNGVLRVVLPKSEEILPREITIQ